MKKAIPKIMLLLFTLTTLSGCYAQPYPDSQADAEDICRAILSACGQEDARKIQDQEAAALYGLELSKIKSISAYQQEDPLLELVILQVQNKDDSQMVQNLFVQRAHLLIHQYQDDPETRYISRRSITRSQDHYVLFALSSSRRRIQAIFDAMTE